METNVPPCLVAGLGMSPCVRERYDWLVHGNGELHGEWEGWRIAGRELIDPQGHRMSLRRLTWLMGEDWLRRGCRKRAKAKIGNVIELRPRAAVWTRPMASGLPAPSDDGGPVAPAGAAPPTPLRGDDTAA